MSYIKPSFRHPGLLKNDIGYSPSDYEGAISTLCAGCGHDSISTALVQACYEMSIEPHRLAKVSGIGCSSKAPTYFLHNSHGFNSVHGRMPSVVAGANLANRDLIYLGVSGDGDTASIGMGQFVHAIRRNPNMVYIVMNNGCYGLTKGQDSATSDLGSVNKAGAENQFHGIDLAAMALEQGASFVARSFSGDKNQLIPLLKAAMVHPGLAFIDIVSPCVTFNNHNGSTKSYSFTRDHIAATSAIDFVPKRKEIKIDYDQGAVVNVKLHDGSNIHLEKLASDWDPTNRESSLRQLHAVKAKGQLLTGLLFVDPKSQEFHELQKTTKTPLNELREDILNPGSDALDKINTSLR